MKKTTLSAVTSSPTSKPTQPPETDSQSAYALKSEFFAAATTMTWQLAIVVLVPIIGGHQLDGYFNTTPIITIVGFLLALGGMSMVIWRQMQLYSPKQQTNKDRHA